MDNLTPSYYVCLHILREPNPRWFILHPVQRRLKPIQLKSYQAPKSSSSFVVMSYGIYIIGGLKDNGIPTADVSFFDCFTHTWHPVEPMNMARASASAHLIGHKIYVLGGCFRDKADSSNWAEVFDISKQTWEFVSFVPSPNMSIKQSVKITNAEDIYAVDEDGQSFTLSPTKGCTFVASGITDSPVYTRDWCLIGQVIFCHGTGGKILWALPYDLRWQEVKGLEELQHSLCMWRRQFGQPDTKVVYDISKLSRTSDGHIVIFWSAQPQFESLELCSAEISLEKRKGSERWEIWGKIEWSGSVFKPDPPLYSSSIKVLYANYLYA